jgi:amino acid adenylation domain-containing protein
MSTEFSRIPHRGSDPEQAGTETGSWHSALYRACRPGDVVRDPVKAVASTLGVTSGPRPGWLRVWKQPVPARHDSAAATRVRLAELGRPLGPLPLRLVLLSYTNHVVDLVVHAHRTVADRRSLAQLAAAVLGQCGSGDARGALLPAFDGSASGECHVVGPVPLPHTRSATADRPDLLAALALVLSRFSGSRDVGLVVMESSPSDSARVTPGHLRYVRVPVAEQTVGTLRDAPDGSLRDQPDGSPPWKDHHAALVFDDVPDVPAEVAYRPAQGLAAPLTVHGERRADGTVQVSVWYRAQSMPEWQAERVLHCLPHVWQALRDGPHDRLVRDVGVLGPADQDDVLALGRAPGPSGPVPSIEAAFAAVAARQPDSVAVCAGDTTLTYRDLDDLATRLARGLIATGVAQGDRVAVLMGRSAEFVAVLLAILRSGAAYVPFDQAYPAERLAFMADDAGVRLVVIDDGNVGVLPDHPTTTIGALIAAPPGTRPLGAEQADDAYVIYTSGSTGRPKGVVVPHANVLNLVNGTSALFVLTPEDVWTWFHSAAFDFSVWEIWGCLLTGGRLVVVPYLTVRSPDEFRDVLAREKVTILNQTPSAFANLLSQMGEGGGRPPDLRLVIFGGEPLDVRMLTGWMDSLPDVECRLVNMYGITETTVHVTAKEVTRAAALAGSRSVGRAIPGWSLRVLDEGGNVLPPGCPGEIAVGGAGVAAGYLNRPDLTAERFGSDAMSGERIYRSGDRGRLLPDGSIEHLGRLDNQVKLRGYRIELDEVQSVLLEDPAVLAAAVVVVGDESCETGAELHAYVVVRPDTTGHQGRIRRWLADRLPDFMVPSTVTVVDELPLNPNGKLDLARLPKRPSVASQNKPPSGIEGLVREVWRRVLGRETDPEGNFFDLGGNSLLALRLTTALRDHGLARVPVRSVYQYPDFRSFVAHLQERTPAERKAVTKETHQG